MKFTEDTNKLIEEYNSQICMHGSEICRQKIKATIKAYEGFFDFLDKRKDSILFHTCGCCYDLETKEVLDTLEELKSCIDKLKEVLK